MALLSADADGPTRWYRRPSLSNLSIIGILWAPFRRRRRGPSDQRLASSRRDAAADAAAAEGGQSSPGVRPASTLRRLAIGAVAGLILAGGLLLRPDFGFGAGAPEFAIGRASVPPSVHTAPEPQRPGAEVPMVPRAKVGPGGVVTDGSARELLPTTPATASIPTTSGTPATPRTPETRVGPEGGGKRSPDRPPAPAGGAGPLAQVAAAASAGVDLRLGLGLGEGSCTGLKVGDLSLGCAPSGRDSPGATVTTGGALLPPLVLSLP